jgi:hypothetical protein
MEIFFDGPFSGAGELLGAAGREQLGTGRRQDRPPHTLAPGQRVGLLLDRQQDHPQSCFAHELACTVFGRSEVGLDNPRPRWPRRNSARGPRLCWMWFTWMVEARHADNTTYRYFDLLRRDRRATDSRKPLWAVATP